MELVLYNNKLPRKRIEAISEQLFGIDNQDLKLTVSLNQDNLNVKQLGDLFYFIYRIDGKLHSKGFNSYSHSIDEQITTSLKFGSLEIILDNLKNVDVQTIIMTWLAIKNLPNLLTIASNFILNFPTSMKSYEEYRALSETRKARKEIRELVKLDSDLDKVDEKNKEKIILLLEEIYKDNPKQLVGARRILKDNLKQIKIEVIKPFNRTTE